MRIRANGNLSYLELGTHISTFNYFNFCHQLAFFEVLMPAC
jgi:hypothetical protein